MYYFDEDADAGEENIEDVCAMEAVPDLIIGNFGCPDRSDGREPDNVNKDENGCSNHQLKYKLV